MGTKLRTAEEKIAWIASGAHGVVTAAELLAAGVTPKQIKARVAKGLLIPVYRGVYRVGHTAWSTDAAYMAATKATDGVLCDLAAAHLLRLLKSPSVPGPAVVTRTERRAKGLQVRRCRGLEERDVTRVRAIPATTVPYTLVDLAAIVDANDLARACHEAGVLYGTTPRHVLGVLERRPNAPNAAALKAVMAGDVKVTLSKLEKAFLKLLAQHGLPLPITNRVAGGRRVDCRWPDKRLTVELLGYRFHNSRRSWEQDLQREREARAREDEFRRFSYADVFEDPAYMLTELRRLLA